jgi:hypothetical protein
MEFVVRALSSLLYCCSIVALGLALQLGSPDAAIAASSGPSCPATLLKGSCPSGYGHCPASIDLCDFNAYYTGCFCHC